VTSPVPANAFQYIEDQLDALALEVENQFDADFLSYSGALIYGTDDVIRIAVETKKQTSQRDRLAMMLTTGGGYVEVVKRIAEVFRRHYGVVEFIVPNRAFSAAPCS
jgi:hypothetical protein